MIADPRRRGAATGLRARRAAVALSLLVALGACSDRVDRAALQRAATDAVFRTIDGLSLTTADLAGPVLVNFWATSCAICLKEAPALVALRERLVGAGYEMISVAMPYDRPDAVLELARANGWRHPVAIDLDGRVLAAFEPVPGTPTNLLLAADGTLAGRWVGRTDLDELERTVRSLLPEAPAARPADAPTASPAAAAAG